MTLPSRHRIRNANPGGLRPNTLPLGHGGSPQYEGMGKKHIFFFQTAEIGKRNPNSSVKGSDANHHPIGPPPDKRNKGNLGGHFFSEFRSLTFPEQAVMNENKIFSNGHEK